MNVCNNFAALKTVNYVCPSRIEQNYVAFVRFVMHEGGGIHVFSDGARIDELNEKFDLNSEHAQKHISTHVKDKRLSSSDEAVALTRWKVSRKLVHVGMENKRSNCWLNCVLQCLYASPLQPLILNCLELVEGADATITLLCGLGSTFRQMKTMENTHSKKVPLIKFREFF